MLWTPYGCAEESGMRPKVTSNPPLWAAIWCHTTLVIPKCSATIFKESHLNRQVHLCSLPVSPPAFAPEARDRSGKVEPPHDLQIAAKCKEIKVQALFMTSPPQNSGTVWFGREQSSAHFQPPASSRDTFHRSVLHLEHYSLLRKY